MRKPQTTFERFGGIRSRHYCTPRWLRNRERRRAHLAALQREENMVAAAIAYRDEHKIFPIHVLGYGAHNSGETLCGIGMTATYGTVKDPIEGIFAGSTGRDTHVLFAHYSQIGNCPECKKPKTKHHGDAE